ncbi:MAG: ABC transporter substrate-binding protein [Chloroflexi bacterium]|nr:ABC transporter substrate-binding protein [Chloroflexota bacterium]
MIKKYFTLMMMFLLLAVFVAGCNTASDDTDDSQTTTDADSSSSDADSGSEDAEPASGEPVKIGVLTPLSPPGDVSAGQLVQRGAELAVKYVNEELGGVLGGRPIEIVMEDDAGTPEIGVAGYRRLTSQENVVGIIGQYHSSVNLAVNEVAKEIGVPVFATQASNKDVTALGYDIAFRTHAVDPVRAESWMSFIQDRGFTKVALISEDTDYGIGLIDEMDNRVEGTNIELNSVVFTRGTPDLTPQLLQIKDWGPDLVINIGTGEAAHLMLDQANTIDLFPEVPMLASYDFPIRPEFWELHPENGSDLYYISYFHPEQQLSASGEWFTAAYTEEYGEPPVYTAYSAFGGVSIIAQAVEQAGSENSEALIEALETGNFENWAGPATFPQEEGVMWHQWTPPLLILHYTEAGQDFRDAELIYEYTQAGGGTLTLPEGEGEDAGEPEAAAPASGEPVKLGVLTPLSPPGDVSAGQLVQRGAELAVIYVNEVMGGVIDGRPIEIIMEDDAGTPEVGVAGYRRLTSQEGVAAIIGQYHSSVNLAVNEVAKEIGVPVFATQASNKDVTALGYDIAFRTHAVDPVRADSWISFIQDRGFTKVALISEDTDYGIGLIDEMDNRVEGTDIELNSVVFTRGTPDLTPQLLQIKDWGPDLVINIGTGEAAHLMLDQANTIDLFPEVPMLASYDFPIRPEFWELHPENGNDLYYISYFHPEQDLSETGEWFTAAYEAEYGEPPVYTAYSAFGGITIIAQALSLAGTEESTALIEALETGDFVNWAGPATFPQADGVMWHQWTPPLLILHYTEAGQSFRDAELIYEYSDN